VRPVTAIPHLERVIVVPRNGYINRLQAWACADILAADLGLPLHVVWEAEPVATTPAKALFGSDLVASRFLSAQELREIIGADHTDLPRYLYEDRSRGLLSLAGHDQGEQVFMPRLHERICSPDGPRTLVIIAGGLFSLPGTQNLVQRRKDFYRSLPWSSDIDRRVSDIHASHGKYLALHIRRTDRSLEAPTRYGIDRALKALERATQRSEVFIAADTAGAVQWWKHRISDRGFAAWSLQHEHRDRSDEHAGIDALIDWRLLAASEGIVFTQSSTFGREAAVASGTLDSSLGIEASRLVRVSRQATLHVRNGTRFVRRMLR